MRHFLAVIILAASALTSSFSLSAKTPGATDTGWDHFVWGAEVGGSCDLTSNNLSSINLDAYFGYSNSWLNAVGVGASVNMMVSSSVRAFPIYAMIRTDFSSQQKLCFMDLRAGVSINKPTYGQEETALYLSPGIGINLARGKTFCSYLTLSYIYNGMKPFDLGDRRCDIDGLSMACLRLGISF